MGRADGIHWGTGASPSGGEGAADPIMEILASDAPTVVNEPEAQWHFADIVRARPDALNIWRASPNVKPAEVNWNAYLYSREVFEGLDAHHERTGMYPGSIMLLNELNLDYERGDSKDDGGAFDTNPNNWPSLYNLLSHFLDELLFYCKEQARSRNIDPNWWYPGWAPGHGEYREEIAAIWVPRAKAYDGITMHSYTTADVIENDVNWYLEQFPQHSILLGEWNTINWEGPGRLQEEVNIRERLRWLAAKNDCLSACYFIYRWAEDTSHQHDIEGSDARLAIWDGRVPIAEYAPEELIVPDNDFPLPVDEEGNEWQASRETVKADTRQVAEEFGIPPYVLWAGFMAESGKQLDAQERWHIWTDEAKGYIAARDKDGLQDILNRGKARGTNDFSFGVGHRAYRWSELFKGDPYNVDDVLDFRKRMIQDHGYAMRDMAKTLSNNWVKTGGDPHQTLYLYNKPDGSASANVKANYDEKLALSAAEWAIPDQATPPPIVNTHGVEFILYNDPEPAGSYAQTPLGCIMHGSRSGKASNPTEAEFIGTANYEVNNSAGLGWTATIGEFKVGVHMSPTRWGWNARAASKTYIAVELAQPTESNPISDGQVEAFCQFWETRVRTIWPNIPDYFPSHAEVEHSGETGAWDGKTDVFSFGSPKMVELRSRITDRLRELRGEASTPPQPTQPSTPDAPARDVITVDREAWERMIRTVGYLGGDLAQRIEETRAQLSIPVLPKASDKMLKADWQERAAILEQMIHDHYAKDGLLKDEIIRASEDALA